MWTLWRGRWTLLIVAATVVALTPTELRAAGKANPAPAAAEPPDPVLKAAADNATLAFDLYLKLRSPKVNTCFSPWGVSNLLAVVYGGARGETAKELADIMHFELETKHLHPAFARLQQALTPTEKSPCVLRQVNAIWLNDHAQLTTDFAAFALKYHATGVARLDFAKADEAGKSINTWVGQQTGQDLPPFLPSGIIHRQTLMFAANLLALRGPWATPFDQRETRVQKFHGRSGKDLPTPLMRTEGTFAYAALADAQMLELPYASTELALVILLPPTRGPIENGQALEELEETISAQKLQEWRKELRRQELVVYLPRFLVDDKVDVRNALITLGLSLPFNSKDADLSGFGGQRGLFIQNLLQRTTIRVNEQGTARTPGLPATPTPGTPPAVAPGTTPPAAPAAVPPATPDKKLLAFRADRPFLFLVRHRTTGTILVIGRLVEPNPGD